jgi:RHS repeat-associated protein
MKKHIFLLGLLLCLVVTAQAQLTVKTLTATEIDSIKQILAAKADLQSESDEAIFNNTSIPNAVTINTSKLVGEIPFTSGVSPSGEMTYHVPIEVYPGNNGFQPSISLAYNHLAGNGVAGIGWDIAELSSISRVTKNRYYDDSTQGVQMDKNDAFELDGMRLIKLSETTTQIKYETEQGNIKVTANLSGNIIKFFSVEYPNGTGGLYEYPTNTSDRLVYPLVFFNDLWGNTINYNYDFVNNHYRINSITYNTNAVLEFEYQSRDDVVPIYEAGLEITENQRLQKIICKFNGNTLRTYELSYEYQKGISAVSQIDCMIDNNSLNPLKFYYGENNTATAYTNTETQLQSWYDFGNSPENLKVVKGKFEYGSDNDGIISFPKKNSYWREKNSILIDKYVNQYGVNEDIFLYADLQNEDVATPMPNLKTEAGFIEVFCADIDGTPGDEVIKVNNIVSGTNDQIKFSVYKKHISGGIIYSYTRTFDVATALADNIGNKSVHPKYYYTGDFNGDGKMEVLAVSCHNPLGKSNTTKCYLFDLESNTKLYEGYVFPYIVDFLGTQQSNAGTVANNTDKLYIMDYDGDGKDDICLINNEGVKIYSFTMSGSNYNLGQKGTTYTELKKTNLVSRFLFLGEFNGDGKPDLLLSPHYSSVSPNSTWSIFYSISNGQFAKKTCESASYYAMNTQFFLQDVNRDGLTDLIRISSGNFWTYIANNGIISSSSTGTTVKPDDSILIPTDITNRNDFSQLICLRNDGKVNKYAFPRNDRKEKLLTGSVNSLGVVQKNYYKLLNEPDSFPPPEIDEDAISHTAATFPYIHYNGAIPVPIYIEQYVKNQQNDYKTYQYYGAVVHRQGLGFCGFQQIISKNKQNQYFIRSYDPFKYGVLTQEFTPASSLTNNWSMTRTNKKVKLELTNSTLQDLLKNTTVTSAYGYDTYGNVISENVNYGDGITTNTTSIYDNDTGYYYSLGYLTDQTKTTTRNGATFSERNYIPAHSKRAPNVKIHYVNDNQVSYEIFAYDTKGNPTQHGLKSYTSSNTLTKSYGYDTYGRLISSTDPLGLIATYDYHPTKGNLDHITNYKQQQTTYNTDVLGRVTSVSYPDGSSKNCTYTWANTGSIGNKGGVFRTIIEGSAQPRSSTYFDALGRDILKTTTLSNGSSSYTDKGYDTYGRLQKVSLPYLVNTLSLWNTYEYDAYNRLTAVNYASGKTDAYSYSGKNVTSVIDGITSTKKYDAAGNLIEVQDAAGTIIYNLRPDGQPSSIVAPGNVTTSFGYDIFGRQTSIIDPSAGQKTFAYDTAGNFQKVTDAKGQEITMAYDEYHRLTTKTMPDRTTAYQYDNYGKLTMETTGVYPNYYIYDNYDRMDYRVEVTSDGQWLENHYTYRSDGNLESLQYRSANSGVIATENYTYAHGYLTEIKLNNTTSIWKLNGVNAFGAPTNVATGSLNRTYGYDDYGFPTARTAGTVQNFSYNFDAATGNLLNRKDNTRNGLAQENFTYDNLGRLTTGTGYDMKGNITQMSGIGSMSYSTPNKPYAISGHDYSSLIPQHEFQSISYFADGRPNTIAENGKQAVFQYDGNGNRKVMDIKQNNVSQWKRYYLGNNYELDQKTNGNYKEKVYLGGDYYSAPAVYVRENGGLWNIYYICRDYLGSITHITNSSGSLVQELSYDAWGRLRNPANRAVYTAGNEPELFLGRGYTGHEHLTQFGLINMNARLYDPAVGRFLSPDPHVQNPLFSQNYNRYSYALNNPLKYTDPTGKMTEEEHRKWVEAANNEPWPEPEDSDDEIGGSRSYGNNFSWGNEWEDGNISSRYHYNPATHILYYYYGNPLDGSVNSIHVDLSGDPFASPFGPHVLNEIGNGIEGLSTGMLLLETGWQYTSKANQQTLAYNIQKTAKLHNVKLKTKAIKGGITKGLKVAGQAAVVADVAITFVQAGIDVSDGKFGSAGARVAVLGLATGASFIPVVGWGVAIGIGVADVVWGDQFYGWVESNMKY